MEALLAAAFGSLMLGLATAVSPCPRATNLAAAAWLARHAGTRRRALLGAAAYTLGRVAAYGAIAADSVAVPVVLFGVGAAVPVAVFGIGVAVSAEFAARFSRAIGCWQARLRTATGAALLAIGLYLIARDSLGWIAG